MLKKCVYLGIGVVLSTGLLFAQEAAEEKRERERTLLDLSLEEILDIVTPEEKTAGIVIYGYMSTNVEKVFGELSVENGETKRTNAPHEWSLPHFHIFLKARLARNVEVFVNLATEYLEVRNMWGNIRLHELFQVRLGKIYRNFGLFNAKLDEVPTYLGIEPPELFDKDHLLLPRTTTFMIWGETKSKNNSISYSLATDNGEGGPTEGVLPLGWDIRAKIRGISLIGLSGYLSSVGNGKISSPAAVGEGSPRGGIMPWMKNDDYKVYGGFAEVQIQNLLIKLAYWQAHHNAERDPASVLTVVKEAGINQRQRERFLGENANKNDDDLTEDDVVVNAEYKILTGYIRLGYFVHTNYGTFSPFVFWDWMEHPETIANKTYGGDNECGVADDGLFYKPTIGVVYKPIEKLAVKLDASQHIQEFNGKTETYSEVRFDISYLFK